MINVLLIGFGTTTLSALESLITTCNVVGVIRNTHSQSNENDEVISLARKASIPVFSDTSPTEIRSLILKFQPDCVVVSSYDRILTPELLKLSTFVNVHYSPLPYYRGRANVNWAIINGESHAAITIHKISPDLDEGNILFQQSIPINIHDSVADLYQALNQIQGHYLGETVVKLVNGYEGVPQDNEKATYCCTRLPQDGAINWSNSTESIDRFVRALTSPFPGAYTFFQGQKLIIWKAEPIETPPTYIGRIPGRVVGYSKSANYVDVLTGDGILRIFEVQFENGNKTGAAQVIKSVKTTLGLNVSDLLERIQILEREILTLKQRNVQ